MTNIVTSKTRAFKGSRADAQGKGTWQRPAEVPEATVAANWCATFGHRDRRRTGTCETCGAALRGETP